MNKKYTKLNFDLIHNMNENQRVAFREFSEKPNAKYLELFKIYTKMDSESILEGNVLEEYEKQTGKKANNDLNENLHRKLCEFIHEQFKETEDPYFEAKKNLEIARTLIMQRHYQSAIVFLEKSFRYLSQNLTPYDNHDMFYQWINLTSRLVQDHPTKEVLNLNEKKFEGHAMFQWFSWIAFSAATSVSKPEGWYEMDYGNCLFMGLLKDYLIEKGRYDSLEKLVRIISFNYEINIGSDQPARQKWMDKFIVTNRTLTKLEGLYGALKLNNVQKFRSLVMEFDNGLQDIKGFNHALFLFMKLHLIDLEIRMRFIPRDISHEAFIANLNPSDFKLMGHFEVANFALRVELNQGIIFILNQDYSSALEIFSRELPFPKANEKIKYYWKLFCLVTYLRVKASQSSANEIDRWLSVLNRMKTGKSVFSVGFIQIVEKNRSTPIIWGELRSFTEKHKPKSLYDEILLTCFLV